MQRIEEAIQKIKGVIKGEYGNWTKTGNNKLHPMRMLQDAQALLEGFLTDKEYEELKSKKYPLIK